jgi:hypothetical protein
MNQITITVADGKAIVSGPGFEEFALLRVCMTPAHEAAHAVLALALGAAVLEVRIGPAELPDAGPILGANTFGPITSANVRAACVLAGPLQDSLAGTGIPLSAWLDLNWMDAATFRECAPTEELRAQIEAYTREFLQANQAQVIRLAEALRRERRLTGEQIRALVDETPAPGLRSFSSTKAAQQLKRRLS